MENKMTLKIKNNNIVIIGIVIIAVLSRFLPHPPNVTPLMAIALFSGALFKNRNLASLIPIGAMFISDIFLGLHSSMFAVYLSFILVVLIGSGLKGRLGFNSVVFSSLFSSVLFYIITNFSVWLLDGLYTLDFAGLINCYVMALPFFRNELLGSLLFNGVFFLAYLMAEKYFIEINPATE